MESYLIIWDFNPSNFELKTKWKVLGKTRSQPVTVNLFFKLIQTQLQLIGEM